MRIVKLKGMRQVNGLHYAPDGRRLLAVGGYEVRSVDEARWVDVGAGAETMRVPLHAFAYAVTPDLATIAINSSKWVPDATPLVVFDPADPNWGGGGARARVINLGVEIDLFGLAFAPKGDRLAVSFQDSETHSVFRNRFVITPLGDQTERVEMAHADADDSLFTLFTFSPHGSWIAASDGSVVSGIDSRTVSWRGMFETTGNQIRRLVFSPDGNTLAVANGKSVLLLPPDLSAPRFTLAHPKQVNAVAFTPDTRRILTTCTDKLVRVWDATTGQLVVSYDWNVGVTNAAAVAPDGLTAAVSGQTGRVVLFDLDG